jgi:hypothetical protein
MRVRGQPARALPVGGRMGFEMRKVLRTSHRFPVLALAYVAIVGLGACLDLQAAPSFRAHLVWLDGNPKLRVTLDPGATAGKDATQTVWIVVKPFNQRGESPEGFVASHSLKLTGDGKPVTATLPVLNPGVPLTSLWTSPGRSGKEVIAIPNDYLRVSVRDDALGLACEELVYPFRPDSPLKAILVRAIPLRPGNS